MVDPYSLNTVAGLQEHLLTHEHEVTLQATLTCTVKDVTTDDFTDFERVTEPDKRNTPQRYLDAFVRWLVISDVVKLEAKADFDRLLRVKVRE